MSFRSSSVSVRAARRRTGFPTPVGGRADVDAGARALSLIGVDAVGGVEEVTLRGVSPLVSMAGPYRGPSLEVRNSVSASTPTGLWRRPDVTGNSPRSAERAGFEPADRFPNRTLSKRVPSATRPPLPIMLGCQRRFPTVRSAKRAAKLTQIAASDKR